MSKQSERTLIAARKFAGNLILPALILLAAHLYVLNAQDIMRFAVIGEYGKGDKHESDEANLVTSWEPD